MTHKGMSLLGMARRAGKLSFHEQANLAAIRSGKAKLLILADDAGTATVKKYINKCTSYRVPFVRVTDRTELGIALGTAPRSAVAVLDDGFANRLKELFDS